MREIEAAQISAEIEKLCIKANCNLNEDIYCALQKGKKSESSPVGIEVLETLLENAQIAAEKQVPICQDTGMVIVFAKVGQEVHIKGDITAAINEGIRRGYQNGYLRKSVVADPIFRQNTGDNTPAVIYYELSPGDQIALTIMPKGFGSENMGAVTMLTPSQGAEGVKRFVVDTVTKAGSNPCPPIVVGVGIGGSMDKAALLSKKALLRTVDSNNPQPYYAQMEEELLGKINQTGIGPQGLGGKVTAMGVNIEVFPTHIAGLPVAVTISCHVTRHAKVII